MEEKLKSKLLYKVHLYILKVIPMVMAFICLLNTTLSYFDIDIQLLSYIASNSILTIIFFYISSYVFKFCNYHRMFIHYTTLTWILNIIDLYIGMPIGDFLYLLISLMIFDMLVLLKYYLNLQTI